MILLRYYDEESRNEETVVTQRIQMLKEMSTGQTISSVSNLMRVKEHKVQCCIIDVNSCELIMKLESIKAMMIASRRLFRPLYIIQSKRLDHDEQLSSNLHTKRYLKISQKLVQDAGMSSNEIKCIQIMLCIIYGKCPVMLIYI